jgi:hypothetical protein
MSTSGTVKKINARSLTLDSGVSDIIVNTEVMSYRLLDDAGFQKIKKVAHIYVCGYLDIGFFDDSKADASSIIAFRKDRTRKVGESQRGPSNGCWKKNLERLWSLFLGRAFTCVFRLKCIWCIQSSQLSVSDCVEKAFISG